ADDSPAQAPHRGAPRAGAGRSDRLLLVLVGKPLVLGDRLVGHLGELEHIVHHLVLEDGRAQPGERLGVLAVEVVDRPLLSRKLAHLGGERTLKLLLGDLDLLLLADARDDETEADASLGDLAVVLPRRLLGGSLVLEGAPGALKIA